MFKPFTYFLSENKKSPERSNNYKQHQLPILNLSQDTDMKLENKIFSQKICHQNLFNGKTNHKKSPSAFNKLTKKKQFFTVNSELLVNGQRLKILSVCIDGKYLVNSFGQQKVLSKQCHLAICQSNDQKLHNLNERSLSEQGKNNGMYLQDYQSLTQNQIFPIYKQRHLECIIFELHIQKEPEQQVYILYKSFFIPIMNFRALNYQEGLSQKSSKQKINKKQPSLIKEWFDEKQLKVKLGQSDFQKIEQKQIFVQKNDNIFKFGFKDLTDFLKIKFMFIAEIKVAAFQNFYQAQSDAENENHLQQQLHKQSIEDTNLQQNFDQKLNQSKLIYNQVENTQRNLNKIDQNQEKINFYQEVLFQNLTKPANQNYQKQKILNQNYNSNNQHYFGEQNLQVEENNLDYSNINNKKSLQQIQNQKIKSQILEKNNKKSENHQSPMTQEDYFCDQLNEEQEQIGKQSNIFLPKMQKSASIQLTTINHFEYTAISNHSFIQNGSINTLKQNKAQFFLAPKRLEFENQSQTKKSIYEKVNFEQFVNIQDYKIDEEDYSKVSQQKINKHKNDSQISSLIPSISQQPILLPTYELKGQNYFQIKQERALASQPIKHNPMQKRSKEYETIHFVQRNIPLIKQSLSAAQQKTEFYRTTYSLIKRLEDNCLCFQILNEEGKINKKQDYPKFKPNQKKLISFEPRILTSANYFQDDPLVRSFLSKINRFELSFDAKKMLLYSTIEDINLAVLQYCIQTERFTQQYKIPSMYKAGLNQNIKGFPLRQVKYFHNSKTRFIAMTQRQIIQFSTESQKYHLIDSEHHFHRIYLYKRQLENPDFERKFDCFELYENNKLLIVGTDGSFVKIFNLQKQKLSDLSYNCQNSRTQTSGKQNRKVKKQKTNHKQLFSNHKKDINASRFKTKSICKKVISVQNMPKDKSIQNCKVYYLKALNSFDLSEEQNYSQSVISACQKMKIKIKKGSSKELKNIKLFQYKGEKRKTTECQSNEIGSIESIYCQKSDGTKYLINCWEENLSKRWVNCFQHRLTLCTRSFILQITDNHTAEGLNRQL